MPIETLPGRKAETDRVPEEISEGFRLAKSERAVPGGAGVKGYATPPLCIEDWLSPVQPLLTDRLMWLNQLLMSLA